ncbi:hypothetical protein GFER_08400 [Geoalkalibacter ferrihydriticus DSM 17813]|uniref:Uncharacterized protein n=1 Tax=Geoalkalibacter ferrihydriticus DSM 17813 TaxID=1121915 RepID=A0A0C2HW96_9BACT|nr:hypothetical protein GFER_08400 [Geoalkalibacter ferrihydriticus DSM 17813]
MSCWFHDSGKIHVKGQATAFYKAKLDDSACCGEQGPQTIFLGGQLVRLRASDPRWRLIRLFC